MVWDLRSPSTPPVRVPTGTDVQGMALSPDGRTLYTGWPLTAYDVASGERIWRREDVTIVGRRLDVNAEGTLLALGDDGSSATRRTCSWWSAADGATVHTLRGHRDRVRDIRFSPDGSLVGSVSGDGEGQEVFKALSKVDAGRGLMGGLAVAFIGIIADRLISAWSQRVKERFGLA